MSFKTDAKKYFSNKDELLNLRYLATRHLFVSMSFLFFLNYFLLSNKFYDQILIYTLPFVYYLFLFSFFLHLYFTVLKYTQNISKWLLILMISVFFVLASVFSIPFIFPAGIKF